MHAKGKVEEKAFSFFGGDPYDSLSKKRDDISSQKKKKKRGTKERGGKAAPKKNSKVCSSVPSGLVFGKKREKRAKKRRNRPKIRERVIFCEPKRRTHRWGRKGSSKKGGGGGIGGKLPISKKGEYSPSASLRWGKRLSNNHVGEENKITKKRGMLTVLEGGEISADREKFSEARKKKGNS